MSTLNLKEANTTIISNGSTSSAVKDKALPVLIMLQRVTGIFLPHHAALHRANRTANSGILESLMSAKSLRNRQISAIAALGTTADLC